MSDSTRPAPNEPKPARRQHVVPRMYLRRFADAQGRLLMTDKRDGRRTSTSLNMVMTERDFYTVETPSGKSVIIEQWLSELEGRTAAIFRTIDGGDFPLVSREDHDVLAVYIAYQLCRGRGFQNVLETAAQGMAELLAMGLAAHPEAMRVALADVLGTDPSPEEVEREEMRRALELKRISTTVPRSMAVGDMIAIAPQVANIIAQRSWTMLSAP